jgi:hypothetical protein
VHGFWKGTILGVVNVFVIAIGVAALEHEAGLMSLVVMLGGLPGLLAGGIIGGAAQAMSRLSPTPRIALLALPAVGVVFGLAHEFAVPELATVSCIPTLVGVLILERWTRVVSAPPVPVARVA